MPDAHSGCGTRPGTIAAMVGMSLGTTAIGITTIAHGTTAGTIPGITDGMIHSGTCGDGLTTDTMAGITPGTTEALATTTHIIHTMVEVAVDIT